jgi:hypothetical protein
MRVPEVVSKVRAYVEGPSSRYTERYSEHVRECIHRLVTHIDVYPVWEGLATDRDPLAPFLFVDACAHALWRWERTPDASDGEIDENLSKLAKAADSLADALDRHAREIAFAGIQVQVNSFRAGPALRSNELLRTSIGSGVPPGDSPEDLRSADPAASGQPNFADFDGPISVQFLLREYARLLSAQHHLHYDPLRPRKRGVPSAERTYLVRVVTEFFLTHGGDPHWDWVVRAVSAMTNTDDLDSSHAVKLFKSLDQDYWEPAEDYRPNQED